MKQLGRVLETKCPALLILLFGEYNCQNITQSVLNSIIVMYFWSHVNTHLSERAFIKEITCKIGVLYYGSCNCICIVTISQFNPYIYMMTVISNWHLFYFIYLFFFCFLFLRLLSVTSFSYKPWTVFYLEKNGVG